MAKREKEGFNTPVAREIWQQQRETKNKLAFMREFDGSAPREGRRAVQWAQAQSYAGLMTGETSSVETVGRPQGGSNEEFVGGQEGVDDGDDDGKAQFFADLDWTRLMDVKDDSGQTMSGAQRDGDQLGEGQDDPMEGLNDEQKELAKMLGLTDEELREYR